MKAHLIFDLDNEEDKDLHAEIVSERGRKLKNAMWSFAQEVLRKYRKYGGLQTEAGIHDTDDAETSAHKAVEHIEKRFYELLDDYDTDIDD